MDDTTTPTRSAKGRFVKGHRLGGRPKGSRNVLSRNSLHAVQNLSGLAIEKLRTLVEQGEIRAIQIVLNTVLPKSGRTVELASSADPQSVVEAMSEGEISPDEATKLSNAWKTANDASKLNDIQAQVDALELLISELKAK